jgi:hypothetical protein
MDGGGYGCLHLPQSDSEETEASTERAALFGNSPEGAIV